jgi:Flp pilus assembly protein TadG
MSSRRKMRDKGAAALEFALVLPLLLILSMAVIEFGRAYNTVISLQGAAREGARVLALGNLEPDIPAVRVAVRNATTFSVADADIVTTPCTTAGGQAKIVVRKAFTFGIPFLPKWSPTLSGDGAMRCGL